MQQKPNGPEKRGDKHQVFVYGTLKHGFSNHQYHLAHAELVGHGTTKRKKWMLCTGGFPVVLDEGEEAKVGGELYAVTDAELARLDRLESNGHLFERRATEIELLDGSVTTAWMYYGMEDAWKSRAWKLTAVPFEAGYYKWQPSVL